MKVIYNLLPMNGYWINMGPLLYHWVTDEEHNHDARYSQSIELSWEEIQLIMVNMGFEIVKYERKECRYRYHIYLLTYSLTYLLTQLNAVATLHL
jgi:hypothetical protein